ncbi:hypothetical protein [Streptomyces sp. NPDC015350]|uniref:hypothetical protein n=1 Tax=Streptomyces sp. NPDC015350 TaxID=3364955 RepID=UPI0036FE15D6
MLCSRCAARPLPEAAGARPSRARSGLRDLTEQAPAHTHRHPGSGRCCVELGSGPWTAARARGNVPARLHIQYCDTW